MAQARLSCGKCGAALTLQDRVCSVCGTAVELPERASGSPQSTVVVCSVCGHKNTPQAEYCESCGARLPGAASAGASLSRQPSGPEPSRVGGGKPEGSRDRGPKGKSASGNRGAADQGPRDRGSKDRGSRAGKSEGERGSGRDPWPIVALLAIVALIGVVVYTQWNRDSGSSRPASQAGGGAAQGAMPAGMMAGGPNVTGVDPAEIQRLDAVVKANPGDAASLVRLGNLLQDGGQYPQAVEAYRKYLSLKPNDPDARVDMGICYYQLGLADSSGAARMFTSAIKEMRTAIAGTPGHQPAAFNLGIVYLQTGNLDSSNAWFKRAVAINRTSDLGTRAQRILEQHQIAQ